MTNKELINLINAYPPQMPVEMVLSDLLYKGCMDVNIILASYTSSLERERHLLNNRFNEAAINLTQILSGNFRKKSEKEEVYKRAIHTFNLNKTLPAHIHDNQYGYTKEDEEKWDEFCKTMYGTDLKE